MKRIKSILLVCMLLGGTACMYPRKPSVAHFDINRLIDNQLILLTQNKTLLIKKGHINGIIDTVRLVPDSTGWATELEVFRELNLINKPTYKKSYEVTEKLKDEKNDLATRIYRTKEKLPVKELKIHYLTSLDNIKKIEGIVHFDNLLYSTRRHLTMEFEMDNDTPILKHYAVEGNLRIIFRDSVIFSLYATTN